MVLVVVVLGVALVAGRLAGGRIANLAELELRAVWLLAVALALQVGLGIAAVAPMDAGAVAGPVMAVSLAGVVGFLVANVRIPGAALMAVGVALNAAVILANGGMPVSPEALEAVGGEAEIDPGKHRLADDDDVLLILADVLPLPALRTVVSIGDVVLAAGVGLTVVSGMRRYPRLPGRRARGEVEPEADRDGAEDPGR